MKRFLFYQGVVCVAIVLFWLSHFAFIIWGHKGVTLWMENAKTMAAYQAVMEDRANRRCPGDTQ